LVFRTIRSGGYYCDTIVGGQLLIAGVEHRLIAMRLGDGTLQIIGHDKLWNPSDEFEGGDMCFEPVGLLLAPASTSEGVARRSQHRHEDLRLADFAGVRV